MKEYKYKRGEYVEDSTKGRALVKPRTYKGDALVQAWVDSRKLAMLSIWLDNGGYNTRYLSDLIKFTIDEVVSGLIDRGIVEKIELTDDAREMLNIKYRVELNPGDRGKRNLHHNLVLDEMRKNKHFEYEVNDSTDGGSMHREIESRMPEAMRIYKELEERDKKKENTSKESDKMEFDENGIFIGRKKEDEEVNDSTPAEHPVDVEDNLRRMEEADKALEEM